jgi:DNA-binding transcriptional LysR family regulator
MAPTAVALQLLEPAATLLREAEQLFGKRRAGRPFDPAAARSSSASPPATTSTRCSCPRWWPTSAAGAGRALDCMPLSADFDYRASLARGEVDLVIGNWLEPPGELHLGRLFTDEVVCLVAPTTRAARPRGWTVQRYLECEHVAPTPLHPGCCGRDRRTPGRRRA